MLSTVPSARLVVPPVPAAHCADTGVCIPMALDAVIFDVDGTLVDTNPAQVEAWVRCAGAALVAGVDAVIFGMPAASSGGACIPPPRDPDAVLPRLIGPVLSEASRELMSYWLACNPELQTSPNFRMPLGAS